jgi:WhiB family transcriptional regulator, redox-sensing transcriptional regulator
VLACPPAPPPDPPTGAAPAAAPPVGALPTPTSVARLPAVSSLTAADGAPALPCWDGDPDLWFAESPADVETAKAVCAPCPVREACLAGALERREPWGVWGGQLVVAGAVVPRKRPRG